MVTMRQTWMLPSIVLVVACATAPVDTFTPSDELPACSADFTRDFQNVLDTSRIDVRNLHHAIYTEPAKKAPWQPVTGSRETLCGRLTRYKVETEHTDEYDWNLLTRPASAYTDMMDAAEARVQDRDDWPKCGTPEDYCVEVEVTPDPVLRTNIWFPPKGSGLQSLLLNREICVYGPWVLDHGNNSQPEIHPSEVIWWENAPGNVELLIVQDASSRFDQNHDYDTAPTTNTDWEPWVQFPMMEEVRIPFEYDRSAVKHTVIDIVQGLNKSAVTLLYPELADSDNGTNHKLRLGRSTVVNSATQRPILVEVNETGRSGDYLGVQFSDACVATDGKILGYVRVLTAIGHPDAKTTGFQKLQFKQQTVADPGGPVFH